MAESHIHSTQCYGPKLTCSLTQHGHGPDCYNKDREGKPNVRICGYSSEHRHDNTCYTDILKCGK